MKRVAVVNGAARQKRYNKFLEAKYRDMGFTMKEFTFNPMLLFSCHLHKYLDKTVHDIIDNHDVIHCESGGYFPIIHPYVDRMCNKPLILECPVLKSSTGTLLAGLNLSKTYDVKDNVIIQKALDTFSFTPSWTEKTLKAVAQLKESNQALVLASAADTVSDNRGKEHLFHHHFSKGAHGRLFFDNDFNIVKDFLEKRQQ